MHQTDSRYRDYNLTLLLHLWAKKNADLLIEIETCLKEE